MNSVLMPQYMKSFKCIGSTCEDTCCSGWRVDIDRKTYDKYKKLKDKEQEALINEYVTKNDNAANSEATYANVTLNKAGECPFLNNERLCSIQMHKGEDYLSDVCATYPRVVNKVNGVLEKSASMSCIEAARLALLNPDCMEFDEMEEPSETRNIVHIQLNTGDKAFDGRVEKYFWELRVFIIDLLQNRTYALWERLVLLGLFLKKIGDLEKSEKVDIIPGIIDSYGKMIESGALKEELASIPAQYTIQMQLLKEIIDRRFVAKVSNKRYANSYKEFLEGVQYVYDDNLVDIGQRYRVAFEKYYAPFIAENEYILENYLVNHVFRNLFPLSCGKPVFNEYILMILNYSLIKLHLVGIAAYHKTLTAEMAVNLIQSFAKSIEHDSSFIRQISDLLVLNGCDTMAYMAILIKN